MLELRVVFKFYDVLKAVVYSEVKLPDKLFPVLKKSKFSHDFSIFGSFGNFPNFELFERIEMHHEV